MFEQEYFNKPFFNNKFFSLPFFHGIGNHNYEVPGVLSSEILSNNDERIIVTFDQEMEAIGDIRQSIWIIIDGAAPVIPLVVTFSGNYMAIVFPSEFTKGEVVTWKYDDSIPTIKLQSKAKVEADNQTYSVTNDLK